MGITAECCPNQECCVRKVRDLKRCVWIQCVAIDLLNLSLLGTVQKPFTLGNQKRTEGRREGLTGHLANTYLLCVLTVVIQNNHI